MDEIFSKIQTPRDIKKYSIEQLNQLSGYLRNEIIQTISKTGGHLASSLGVVEITVALHYIFNAPDDKIIWDVGHQCYAHKLLTGRNEKFCTIRQYQGISGFTRSCESCFDPFGAGHSSTSISSALGFAAARDQLKEDYEVIAVIGDGAMTGGLAFEGLNNAGHLKSDLIVVLNDNEMSIAKNVGAISRYLNKIRMEPHYVKFRDEIRHLMEKIPKFGKKMLSTAERIEDSLIYAVIPGVLFEAMGFTYLGPFDGHNMESIIPAFKQAKELNGPRLIHVTTQKGRGFQPAEKDATSWHGAIPFNPENGKVDKSQKQIPQYNEVFCDTLIKLALDDPKIVAITAAMPDGTGLIPFKDEFPERFYDVGIAEQHALTFAAGMAAGGLKPVAAIYSTFLQRAYDQIIHDICLQNLPVVICMDRGGIVGEDGPTHHGVFDLSFLRSIPGMTVMAPRDENELQHMLKSAINYCSPVTIRYPRGQGVGVPLDTFSQWEVLPRGKAEIMNEGKDIAILAVGSMVYPAILAAEKLNNYGIKPYVVNMRFVKPIDEEIILKLARETSHLVTVEENVLQGGFGSAVMEVVHNHKIKDCLVQSIGIPDKFIEQGEMNFLKEKYGLTSEGIVQRIREALQVVG